MKAKSIYEKKIADKFHDTAYYGSNEYSTRNLEFIEKKGKRLSAFKRKHITEKINDKKKLIKNEVFKILKNIYEKNKNYAFSLNNEKEPINSDLINIVANVPLLITCYYKVIKNPGSITQVHQMSDQEYNLLNEEQKNLTNKIEQGVDGFDLMTFQNTAKLLKLGKYPWGTSKRIYIDKSEKPGKKRPITIPSFMDKVVQEAIKTVLVAIYEPYFDKMNVSFGFRPGLSVHDAIYPLTSELAQGLNKALEGDIEGAYGNVNREKLIEILAQKIKDKNFLDLIKKRLDCECYDTVEKTYFRDKIGIPQGGTDSPYLWNIYMLVFDIFITENIGKIVEKINKKTRGIDTSKKKRFLNNERINLKNMKITLSKILQFIRNKKYEKGTFKDDLKRLKTTKLDDWKRHDPILSGTLKNAKKIFNLINLELDDEVSIIKKLQKEQKRIIHKMNNTPFFNQDKKLIRFIYVRYADDWIFLTNMKRKILEKIKKTISIFLEKILYVKLSDEKTLITNIKTNPAHFLGFEIRSYRKNKITKYKQKIKDKEKIIKAKTTGNIVFAGIDKQRLIDRLHMKGYCDSNGKPREITKLNNLEAFTIIDKTNSVLTGLVNFYLNWVKNGKKQLNRWIYIIRYSCIKTLALKYKTTVRKILRIFTPEYINPNEAKTIEDSVIIEIDGLKYKKKWKLYTQQDLLNNDSRRYKEFVRRNEVVSNFWSLHKGELPDYYTKTKTSVKNIDSLEKINWINKRTTASFELPCCICGCSENIQMHHLKQLRKINYNNLKKTWEQVMGLRNRKQIPVCANCHINIIHKGKYGDKPLKDLSIDRMYDNRLINIETYIHKGNPDVNYKKSLLGKGWEVIYE